ncbi:hypothetical protein F5Y02DRAFT_281714 [Annulohypoxylon stygium]|nr:hypothetical protein F5Y02DRAFT_281714 [Annulohypoxylon stygium]
MLLLLPQLRFVAFLPVWLRYHILLFSTSLNFYHHTASMHHFIISRTEYNGYQGTLSSLAWEESIGKRETYIHTYLIKTRNEGSEGSFEITESACTCTRYTPFPLLWGPKAARLGIGVTVVVVSCRIV